MIRDMHFLQDHPLVHTAWEICRWHHERWDGKGYPDGLKGEEIPISAQVVSIVQSVDTAVWDKSEPVAQTIDTEFLNTDHRMVAVPMLGTVTKDYFNTVTFAGDSIASGLGIYDTGYHNAHYATYVSAGVQTFVNNVSVKNAVTGATETPMETIAASHADYPYILGGTNNLAV